jgi:hypothetical protein
MKRVAQFFLIVLVLMTANLAAAQKGQKGGSRIYSKAGGAWYYCYDPYGTGDPGPVEDCGTLSSCACRAACEYDCGGPCDWDDTCPN